MKNIRREDWESLEPTVYGWGINDVNYKVYTSSIVDGKKVKIVCHYYKDWKEMLKRCLDPVTQTRLPTYRGCTICEEWKYLSNFIKWVDSQPNRDWQNCDLDKDLLFVSNKIYSPETCAYLHPKVNLFLLTSTKIRGCNLIGVSNSNRNKNPFESRCCNPFNNGSSYIGMFCTELDAHKAWQERKHLYACQLADLQEDTRVADALRQRYAPDKDWTKA